MLVIMMPMSDLCFLCVDAGGNPSGCLPVMNQRHKLKLLVLSIDNIPPCQHGHQDHPKLHTSMYSFIQTSSSLNTNHYKSCSGKKLLTSANTNLEASPSLPLQVINPHDRSIQHDEGRLALNPFCSILPHRAWRTHLRVLFASPEMLEGAPSTDADAFKLANLCWASWMSSQANDSPRNFGMWCFRVLRKKHERKAV